MEFHEYANLFPMMTPEEMQSLRADMRANGYRAQYPILLHEGQILDGRNRYTAALNEGLDPIYGNYGGDDPLAFVISSNLNRRHMNESQRGVVAAKLANMPNHRPNKSANLPTKTQSEAAAMLNVSPRMIRDVKKIEREAPELIPQLEAGMITAHKALQEIKPHVARNSGQNEWYTPPEYIQAARAVMGTINTDPASSEIANCTVKADVYHDMSTNGLEQKWGGNVWMNPPYSQPLIAQFCQKLNHEFKTGNIRQACVLVNNATETGWFRNLVECASAVCFPSGRIKFLDIDGNPGAPLQGQAIIYIGENTEAFYKEFIAFGFVLYV